MDDMWKVIIADDEMETHHVTRMVLRNYSFEGKKLCFLSAYSGEETLALLHRHPDTAILLLDVVMEKDSAGLDVVRYIRDELNNQLIQIILRTGHSGYAPENTVIAEYGINDYKSKIDLTSQKLFTTITTLLRAYCLSYRYNQLNQTLAGELKKRLLAEIELQKARDHLEQRVEERTCELEAANLLLKQEIAARTRAEEELRKSDEMTRSLLNATSDIAFLMSPDGLILSINETAAKRLDTDIGECSKETLDRFFPPRTIRSLQMKVAQVIRSGHPARFEEMLEDGFFDVGIFPVFGKNQRIEKLAVYAHDITDAKQAAVRIHTLTHDLINAQENERERISRDLHDRVAQDLSTSRIICETLFDSHAGIPEEILSKASRLSRMLQKTIRNIRDIAYDLRPPILDQLGLAKAVFRYCEEFSETEGVPIDFHSIGVDNLNMGLDMEINLYRLIQEALNNIRKHAEATRVRINMVASFPHLLLRITDNGKGFDVEQHRTAQVNRKRMGLRSMEERVALLNGNLDIQSRPGAGTRILIEVPFSGKKNPRPDGNPPAAPLWSS
ncbi:MAG: response regulator [Desulfobacteraceae bacterium]|nr:MAG: response regulator [Desulfobacteraceae bacterium]